MNNARFLDDEYISPVSVCVEIMAEGAFCGSPLRPGESEDAFWGDDL